MAGYEERGGTVRVCLSDLSEGKGRASETRGDYAAIRDISVEVGQNLDGLCDPFAMNLQRT